MKEQIMEDKRHLKIGNVAFIICLMHLAVLNDSKGSVVSWGSNLYGQSPATPPSVTFGAKSMAAGYWHNLAVKSSSLAMSWGLNDNGQTNVPANLGFVLAVAGGRDHSLVLKSNKTVVAWGDNTYGQ